METAIKQQTPSTWRLSWWRKLLFGLAAPPLQMTSNVCGFFFSVFLLEVANLTPAQVSIITFSGRAWDAITDPIVGQLLFRTRTRLGRTQPWLMAATPIGCVAFSGMWLTIPVTQFKFAYYFAAYLLYCLSITCYHVPYTSSTILLSPHSKDRDDATAVRIAFDLIFTVLGSAIFGSVISRKRLATNCNATIISSFTNGSEMLLTDMVQQERDAYLLGGCLISILCLICGLVAILGIKEKVKPAVGKPESLIVNVRTVLQFKPYLILMFAFLFMSLAIQTVQVNLALFTTHSIGLGAHTMPGIVCILCVAVLAVPMWHFVAVKFGKKVVFISGLLPLIPCLTFGALMPANSLIAYYSVIVVSGLSISVAMLVPWAMLPDVIDDFLLKHNERKEATFYSLYVFFTKFASGLSIAVSQLALGFGQYDSMSCWQPNSVGITLRVLVGPAPIVCIVISLLLICQYPIDRKYRLKLDQLLRDRNIELKSEMISTKPELLSNLSNAKPAPVDADSSNSSSDSLRQADSSVNLLSSHRVSLS